MKAIVLAGGFGSRLKPLTDSCPKPLLRIAGKQMLDYTVAQLHAYGINDITYTLHYYANDIISFCSGYRELRQGFVTELNPLGTCGGVKAACGGAGDTFIVVSGDVINNIDLSALMVTHYNSDALVTMAVTPVENPSLYGVVRLDGAKVTGFVEKPQDSAFGNLINCGVYVVDRRALRYVPENTVFDFARDLFPILLGKGRLAAYRHEGYWSDIGDFAGYYKTNFDMSGGGFYPRVGNRRVASLSLVPDGSGVYAADTAVLKGYTRNSIVGESSVVDSAASVTDCIVLDGARADGIYSGAIIGRDFVIQVGPEHGVGHTITKTFEKFFENSSN